MSDVGTIREAARVLRERASDRWVSEDPWRVDGEVGREFDDLVLPGDPAERGIVADCDTSTENALYIATMNPLVGLALADLLDVAWRAMMGTNKGDVLFEDYIYDIARAVLETKLRQSDQ